MATTAKIKNMLKKADKNIRKKSSNADAKARKIGKKAADKAVKRYGVNKTTGKSVKQGTYKTNVVTGKVPTPKPKTRSLKAKSATKAKTASSAKAKNYPVYKKSSAKAGSFRSAFSAARKAGKSTFMWEGRKYTTEMKKSKPKKTRVGVMTKKRKPNGK